MLFISSETALTKKYAPEDSLSKWVDNKKNTLKTGLQLAMSLNLSSNSQGSNLPEDQKKKEKLTKKVWNIKMRRDSIRFITIMNITNIMSIMNIMSINMNIMNINISTTIIRRSISKKNLVKNKQLILNKVRKISQ